MEQYGICHLSFIPLRKEPDHRSEMLSQLLFGETYKILERRGDWLLIEQTYDAYQGWIDRKVNYKISDEFEREYEKEKATYSAAFFQQAGSKLNFVTLGFGSRLPFWDGNMFSFEGEEFLIRGEVREENPDMSMDEVLALAIALEGVPYLWGGKSVFGIDCSGFVQNIFKFKAVHLPRDASQQIKVMKTIDFNTGEKGDVAFFSNEYDRITHVGILMGEGKIIHASGKVRIDRFDDKGIYNNSLSEYTHKLHSLGRINDLNK